MTERIQPETSVDGTGESRPGRTRPRRRGAEKLGLILVGAAAIALAVQYFTFDSSSGVFSPVRMAAELGAYVLFAVGGCCSILGRRRRKREVLASALRLCPNCGYALTGLPADGRCPECGERFADHILREIWRREFRLKSGDSSPRPRRGRTEWWARFIVISGLVCAGVGLLAGVVSLAVVALTGGDDSSATTETILYWMQLFIPAVAVLILLSAMTWWAARYRLRSVLWANDFLLCPFCRCSLKNTGESGVCPQCGRHYRACDVRKCWEAEFLMLRKSKRGTRAESD